MCSGRQPGGFECFSKQFGLSRFRTRFVTSGVKGPRNEVTLLMTKINSDLVSRKSYPALGQVLRAVCPVHPRRDSLKRKITKLYSELVNVGFPPKHMRSTSASMK
jgi:hypothetical protein